MNTTGLLPVLVLLGLGVLGAFTSYVASQKGYSGTVWFLLGSFFPFIALLAVIGLPQKDH